jgi:thiol-disulfide isomerase/thioredoxin
MSGSDELENSADRRAFLSAAALTLAAGRLATRASSAASDSRISTGGELDALRAATKWLNSRPLTADALRGKVVVIDFWTYTCVNWLRTLPYVRAWAGRYKDDGLVVIGVHTPEFPFEHDVENVRRAAKDMRVEYPVAIDNDYAIWRGFRNQYWPALYVLDAHGRIRYHQFGEGEYEQSERVIQQMLNEAGARQSDNKPVGVEPAGAEVAADWRNLRSPESYFGYGQAEHFASRDQSTFDKPHTYAQSSKLSLNDWTVAGNWTITKGAARLNAPDGRVACRFHARDVNLVMGPATRGSAVRFHVLLDGQPAVTAHGVDVEASGNGTASEQRLYQLIRQAGPIEDRLFEIEFIDAGIEIFAFTFG